MNVPSIYSAYRGATPGLSLAGASVAPGLSPARAARKGGVTTARAAAKGAAAETPAHRKLRKAAQEFEGILISQLLQDMPMGFSSLSGDTPMAGSETLSSLAVQTLSNAMAGRGGFGIARMIVHQLEPSLNRGGPQSVAAPQGAAPHPAAE